MSKDGAQRRWIIARACMGECGKATEDSSSYWILPPMHCSILDKRRELLKSFELLQATDHSPKENFRIATTPRSTQMHGYAHQKTFRPLYHRSEIWQRIGSDACLCQQRPSCRRSITIKSIERYRDVQTPPEDEFILFVDFSLPLYIQISCQAWWPSKSEQNRSS